MGLRRLAAALGRRVRALGASGFPWHWPARGEAQEWTRFRIAARRAMLRRWPGPLRPFAWVGHALLWPVRSLIEARRAVRAFRAAPVRTCRTTRMLWLSALRHSARPAELLAFEGGLGERASAWASSVEVAALNVSLTAPELRRKFSDKLVFASLAAELGLLTPKIHVVFPNAEGSLPKADIVAKRRVGAQGRGVEIWQWTAAGFVRHGDGGRHPQTGALGPDELRRLLSGAPYGLIAQELVEAHPDIASLSRVGPPVARIVTGRSPGGDTRVLDALLQRPALGRALSQSGSFRLIDVVDGWLLPRLDRAPYPGLEDDPEFSGVEVPGWCEAATQLAQAHASLPGPVPLVGWDVVFSQRGAVVLEANLAVSPYFFQLASRRPSTWPTVLAEYVG